jgi:hypothetical protein
MASGADCFERIEATLKRSVAALTSERVPFLLGGSLAVWARGGPETCNDLDLMVRPDDAERALAALERVGMRTERPAEGWLYKARDDEVAIDLIFSPRAVPVDDETFARAELVSVFGVELPAMSLEDVLVSKLLARPGEFGPSGAPGYNAAMPYEELAAKIAEVSSMEYEDALAALQAGNGSKETALEILRASREYKQDLEGIEKARRKLRDLALA